LPPPRDAAIIGRLRSAHLPVPRSRTMHQVPIIYTSWFDALPTKINKLSSLIIIIMSVGLTKTVYVISWYYGFQCVFLSHRIHWLF